jgi:hypothetical protein
VVRKYADRLADDAKDYLEGTDPFPTVATGTLQDSIKPEVIGNRNNIIEMRVVAKANYAKYVASGRKPWNSFPPIWAIEDWVDVKGIDREAVYPIARAIAIRGIKAKPFLREPWSRLRPDFKQELINVVNRNSRYWRKSF